MSYQPGIPTGNVNLDVDYQNLQNNFQQLDTQFGIDHIPFSNTSGTPPTGVNGYHQNIHFNPFSTTTTNPPNNYIPASSKPSGVPAATPGFGQLFSCQVNDGLATDHSLYWLTGGNRLIPLTRNLTPLPNTNGYTFLPGGLIFQWGRQTLNGASNETGTVVFATSNINFPNACRTVQLTLISNSGGTISSNNTLSVIDTQVGTNGFKYQYNGNGGGNYPAFYWMAIGN